MTFVFKHPKFYRIPRDKEEARAQLKVPSSNSDQVISKEPATAGNQRAPGPGLKPQAPSCKPQAKPEPSSGSQGASHKPQAPSSRVQASSHKRQAS